LCSTKNMNCFGDATFFFDRCCLTVINKLNHNETDKWAHRVTTATPTPTTMKLALCLQVVLSLTSVDAETATCGTPKECRTFAQIYDGDSEKMCNNIFGTSFKYERNETNAYAMWWNYGDNPNTAVTNSLEELFHVQEKDKDVCHLAGDVTTHHETPQFDQSFNECRPWSKGPACCQPSTVSSTEKLRLLYGPEYTWDRCGSMSSECARFFAAEACFYECEPALGHFRKFPISQNTTSSEHNFSEYSSVCDSYSADYNKSECDTGTVNHWEVYRMPIKASYCDSWYAACADDLFCGDGDYFACSARYRSCDAEKKQQLEQELNDTQTKLRELENEVQTNNNSLQNNTMGADDENDTSATLGGGVMVGVIIAALVGIVLVVSLVVLITKEKQGKSVFTPLDNDKQDNSVMKGSYNSEVFEQPQHGSF